MWFWFGLGNIVGFWVWYFLFVNFFFRSRCCSFCFAFVCGGYVEFRGFSWGFDWWWKGKGSNVRRLGLSCWSLVRVDCYFRYFRSLKRSELSDFDFFRFWFWFYGVRRVVWVVFFGVFGVYLFAVLGFFVYEFINCIIVYSCKFDIVNIFLCIFIRWREYVLGSRDKGFLGFWKDRVEGRDCRDFRVGIVFIVKEKWVRMWGYGCFVLFVVVEVVIYRYIGVIN